MWFLGLLIDLLFMVWWLVCSLMEVGVMSNECVDDDRACWLSMDVTLLLGRVSALELTVLLLEARTPGRVRWLRSTASRVSGRPDPDARPDAGVHGHPSHLLSNSPRSKLTRTRRRPGPGRRRRR